MFNKRPFYYIPQPHEAEKASNSYLMSLVAIMGGLPLPVVNLIATFFFYRANREAGPFVRWHCTQALLSQISLVIINGFAFWWTMLVIFRGHTINSSYIAYIICVLVFNLIEFIATIYSAIQTRKSKHVEWWFYGSLTNLIYQGK
jgi:uncharacterized Tic20 family protein